MSSYDSKALLELMMSEEENRKCIDCGTPSPQWASLSYAIYVCLTCSGVHRSLGVHISFVRSLTMDKWKEEQITKMKMGGNAKCRQFFESNAEYDSSMSIADKYNAYFALQYKDKLSAGVEGRTWNPSDTPRPAPTESTSSLRKPRLTNSRSATPSSLTNSSRPSPTASYNSNAGSPAVDSQKSRNEDYFASMGSANDSRRSDLPPSQGGKYGGFGSDSNSGQGSSNAMNGNARMSSRALPSVDDFRDDPVSALGKGWGVFGAALRNASRTINETVVQPTMERAQDPNLHSSLSAYYATASSTLASSARAGGSILASGLSDGSNLLREKGFNVGDLGSSYLERATGRGAGEGYGRVSEVEAPREGGEREEEDFFGAYDNGNKSGAGGLAKEREGIWKDERPTPVSNAGRQVEEPTPTLLIPDYGGEDAWAKLSPASSARREPLPGLGAKKVTAVKKEIKTDDWDDFGTDDWKN